MVGNLVAEAAAGAVPNRTLCDAGGVVIFDHRHNAGERMSPGACFAGLLTGLGLHAAATVAASPAGRAFGCTVQARAEHYAGASSSWISTT
jgi:hypothetical protein